MLTAVLIAASVSSFAQKPITKTGVALAKQPYVSQVWNPDLGNGMYKNPVINADKLHGEKPKSVSSMS